MRLRLFLVCLFALIASSALAASTTFSQLPPAIGLGANDIFPLDHWNGPSPPAPAPYTTQQTTLQSIAQFVLQNYGGTITIGSTVLSLGSTSTSLAGLSSISSATLALGGATLGPNALAVTGSVAINGTITAPSLATSGTIAGSICATSAGLLVNNASGNCYAGSGGVTSVGQTFTGGLISVSGSPITTTGTLALTVAGTSGGIPYFSSASGWASSAALTANALMIGGGAATAPSTTATGANVLTALGNAINAASGLPNVDGAITTGNCLKWGPGVQDAGAACGAGGVVSSVANSDSSLTISPTTGAVVASLNVGHANTWSAVQTFGANDLVLSGVTGSTQCLEASSSGVVTGTGGACGSGSGAVNSVSNSDGSLTISPTSGAVVASIAELLAGTPVIGSLLNTEVAAPSTPASGKVSTWVDSTDARFHDKNPAATVGTTVVANAGTTHQWVASMSTAGVLTTSQPAFTDISGTAGIGQIPTGTSSSTVPLGGVITAGGPTGSATSVPVITYNAAGQLTAVSTAAIVPLAAPFTTGTGGTVTGAYGYYNCTTTCSITLPAPAAGDQFCIRNDDAVTTVITIAAISGVQFEKTTFAGYGTVTTGTMVSGGAAGDKVCLVGRDATHYLVGSFNGTWTNS
jgi:hypothetical protein